MIKRHHLQMRKHHRRSKVLQVIRFMRKLPKTIKHPRRLKLHQIIKHMRKYTNHTLPMTKPLHLRKHVQTKKPLTFLRKFQWIAKLLPYLSSSRKHVPTAKLLQSKCLEHYIQLLQNLKLHRFLNLKAQIFYHLKSQASPNLKAPTFCRRQAQRFPNRRALIF